MSNLCSNQGMIFIKFYSNAMLSKIWLVFPTFTLIKQFIENTECKNSHKITLNGQCINVFGSLSTCQQVGLMIPYSILPQKLTDGQNADGSLIGRLFEVMPCQWWHAIFHALFKTEVHSRTV